MAYASCGEGCVVPTAQMSVADDAPTAESSLKVPEGVGVGTCVQAAPSQRRIRVWSAVGEELIPTAQTLLAELA